MLASFLKELLRGKQTRQALADDCITRGLARQQAGDLADAERLYRAALERAPDHPDALHLLGNVVQLQGRLDEAVAVLARLVERETARTEARLTLAGCLSAIGRLAEAETHYRRALELNPEFLPAYINWSNLMRGQDRLEEAVRLLREALRRHPESAEAHHNLGKALYDSNRALDALASFERAAALAPDNPDIRCNYGDSLLAAGHFARGWQEYEYRFDLSEEAALRRPFAHPFWRGEALEGRGLLVWGEQGVGDEILFAGTYADLMARGGRCVFECAPKLVALFTRSFPGATVVARSDPPHPATGQGIAWQCAAGSVARYVRPTLESFPSRPGFLVADAGRVRHWGERFAALGPGLKVGFCWRSSNLRGKRALSCTRLEEWGALFRVPGVRWVSLQYDRCEEELAGARREFGVELHRFGEVDYFDDLDEVSAMMGALDLVISAPTVVSVQAGALGVAVWQMSYGPDWQTHGTPGNPWFPSMVRFARRAGQEWAEVLESVAQRLRERAGERAPS